MPQLPNCKVQLKSECLGTSILSDSNNERQFWEANWGLPRVYSDATGMCLVMSPTAIAFLIRVLAWCRLLASGSSSNARSLSTPQMHCRWEGKVPAPYAYSVGDNLAMHSMDWRGISGLSFVMPMLLGSVWKVSHQCCAYFTGRKMLWSTPSEYAVWVWAKPSMSV